jgi:hypothetical protein
MIAEIVNPDQVSSAEIVVGIPSYNEADTIPIPVDLVSKGLKNIIQINRLSSLMLTTIHPMELKRPF